MSITIVVGNPRPRSRTAEAARRVAAAIAPDLEPTVVELAHLGPRLFNRSDPDVAAAVTAARTATVLVLATPTYKATFTGLLKLFLEQFDGGTGLAGRARRHRAHTGALPPGLRARRRGGAGLARTVDTCDPAAGGYLSRRGFSLTP